MDARKWQVQLIVAGVDGSEPSNDAAMAAANLARSVGARLHLVTVVRPPEGWWGIVESPPPAEALGNALAEAQRKVLDAVVEATDLTGVEYETVEEIGDPGKALAAYCETHDVDLLVIGRHGAGLLDRVTLGSVGHRLVHHAPCPVLVVP